MNPNDIYNALTEIRDTFPKSSSMVVALISSPGTKSAFDNAFERTVVITAKNGWSLENKSPTMTYAPTDETVIGYVRTIAEEASQSRINLLVVIDLSDSLTSVWVTRRSACFIATAAYGSPLAPEVTVLSQFRDDVLTASAVGRFLVHIYYCVSPPIASAIDSRESMKFAVRKLLHPIVRIVGKRARSKPGVLT
jgi:hypothetical protein